MTEGTPNDGLAGLRADFGALIRQLLEESHRPAGQGVGPLLRAHLGTETDAARARIYTEELERWELPNLQLALDASVERPGWTSEVLGWAGTPATTETSTSAGCSVPTTSRSARWSS